MQYLAIFVQSRTRNKYDPFLCLPFSSKAKDAFPLNIPGFKFDVRERDETIASCIGAKQRNKDKGGKGEFIGPGGRALRI